jgi:hypothetical protein
MTTCSEGHRLSAAWSLGSGRGSDDYLDRIGALGAIALLIASSVVAPMAVPPQESGVAGSGTSGGSAITGPASGETFLAFYAGHPWYHRSDGHLRRPDGTDLTLKGLGWDGDAFYPPIDGGLRAVRWNGAFGGMIDFLHNKAIARVGKGSHGREITNPVIETVDVTGTIKGAPAPERLKLTDYFTRLEFTHGHNTLMAAGLVRLGSLTRGIRPYVGAGLGIALPHTEVRFTGEKQRTSEYQYGGPALQVLAGLELRTGRTSYFLEYKFVCAWIDAAITGETSWLNWDLAGDLWRQLRRWQTGAEPKHGRFSTVLASHQVFIGGGYWLQHGTKAP